MEFYNSTTNLKDLLNKILTTKVTEVEILDFSKYITTNAAFGVNYEHDLLVLEIYTVLKRINNLIPLIEISLEAIPEKIIFSQKQSSPTETLKKEEPIQSDTSSCDQNCELDMKMIKKKFIERYSPFKQEDNPGLVYPAPGQMGNVIVEDRDILPGKMLLADVSIDSDGNILGFIKEPREVIKNTDFDSIYSGLIGQLFEFQKNEE